jgi:protein-histidine pros-kinase
MGIRAKFNLAFFGVFGLGMVLTAIVGYRLLAENAKGEVARKALLMMEAATSVRSYTIKHIGPRLNQLVSEDFLPQTVPAFAATETIGSLGRVGAGYIGYAYKEATLNPTNPRDQASDWERELVNTFRADSARQEIIGERSGAAGGRILFIARPIKITDAACLACHSTPSAAPASLLRTYGDKGGFGWNLNEVVGAQVVAVPMSIPLEAAQRAFWTFISALGVILVTAAVILNLMLERLVVRPVIGIAEVAERVSTGDFSQTEFESGRQDEIGRLSESFNRMRRSLEQAMKMIR